MTLKILIAHMSAFREAQADESVMNSFAPYSPECVELEFSEVPHRPDPMRQRFLCRVSKMRSPAYIRVP
jgi:hypothetical protein